MKKQFSHNFRKSTLQNLGCKKSADSRMTLYCCAVMTQRKTGGNYLDKCLENISNNTKTNSFSLRFCEHAVWCQHRKPLTKIIVLAKSFHLLSFLNVMFNCESVFQNMTKKNKKKNSVSVYGLHGIFMRDQRNYI